MLKNGFLWFCDEQHISYINSEAELMRLRSKNASLRAQLAESQRREREMLADMEQDMACGICAHSAGSLDDEPCVFCHGWSSKFEWRGPQEAGKEMQ